MAYALITAMASAMVAFAVSTVGWRIMIWYTRLFNVVTSFSVSVMVPILGLNALYRSRSEITPKTFCDSITNK